MTQTEKESQFYGKGESLQTHRIKQTELRATFSEAEALFLQNTIEMNLTIGFYE